MVACICCDNRCSCSRSSNQPGIGLHRGNRYIRRRIGHFLPPQKVFYRYRQSIPFYYLQQCIRKCRSSVCFNLLHFRLNFQIVKKQKPFIAGILCFFDNDFIPLLQIQFDLIRLNIIACISAGTQNDFSDSVLSHIYTDFILDFIVDAGIPQSQQIGPIRRNFKRKFHPCAVHTLKTVHCAAAGGTLRRNHLHSVQQQTAVFRLILSAPYTDIQIVKTGHRIRCYFTCPDAQFVPFFQIYRKRFRIHYRERRCRRRRFGEKLSHFFFVPVQGNFAFLISKSLGISQNHLVQPFAADYRFYG